MKEVIQKLLFPTKEIVRDHYGLYYRGERGVETKENGQIALNLAQFSYADFTTLFNGVSIAKWKKYTGMSSLSLSITLQGKGTIRLVGAHLCVNTTVRTFYGEIPFDHETQSELEITFPDMEETLAGFEIETRSPVTIYGGAYSGEFDTERDVNLAIATTTCRKEKYITENVLDLKENLLDSDRLISHHLTIHVVDNGRTLKCSDFPESDRIFLHPNKNVGGSGGYARGIIESLHQSEPATHILLMDDDVVVETESVNKTFVLLRHLKKEYQRRFISGAMMLMEAPNEQSEDIGYVKEDGFPAPVKPHLFQHALYDNLLNEMDFFNAENTYAGWWYCVVPAEAIRENGLPMPYFIHADDIEFSLRNNPGFITMNGICIWHKGFGGRFNVIMDEYQMNRNLMITASLIPNLSLDKILHKVQMDFRKHALRFDYGATEIILRGIEDYLKGPSFLEKDCGEKIIQELNQKRPEKKSTKQYGITSKQIYEIYAPCNLKRAEQTRFDLTINGQLLYPGPFRKGVGMAPFDNFDNFGKEAFYTKLYIIDPYSKTAFEVKRDPKEFARLFKRYHDDMKLFRRKNASVEHEYQKKRTWLVSEKFWRQYLEI